MNETRFTRFVAVLRLILLAVIAGGVLMGGIAALRFSEPSPEELPLYLTEEQAIKCLGFTREDFHRLFDAKQETSPGDAFIPVELKTITIEGVVYYDRDDVLQFAQADNVGDITVTDGIVVSEWA